MVVFLYGIITLEEQRGFVREDRFRLLDVSCEDRVFGSRQRVANTLGNLPECLANSFDGNLTVLHFDK